VDAARNRTTLGKISDALETVLEGIKHKLNPLVACIVKKKDDKVLRKQNSLPMPLQTGKDVVREL
jgi:hypothetical protein